MAAQANHTASANHIITHGAHIDGVTLVSDGLNCLVRVCIVGGGGVARWIDFLCSIIK